MEVEPLHEPQLEDLGLNTCNHDISLSSREVPSFDKPEPQLLPNFSPLDVNLGDERGPKPPIKPLSSDSFRMKVVDPLTIHTPPSPHVASFHPKDMYCYYHPLPGDGVAIPSDNVISYKRQRQDFQDGVITSEISKSFLVVDDLDRSNSHFSCRLKESAKNLPLCTNCLLNLGEDLYLLMDEDSIHECISITCFLADGVVYLELSRQEMLKKLFDIPQLYETTILGVSSQIPLIHVESRKSPTTVLFDVDTERISIRHCEMLKSITLNVLSRWGGVGGGAGCLVKVGGGEVSLGGWRGWVEAVCVVCDRGLHSESLNVALYAQFFKINGVES
ncbi:hypothetical protein Tco_0084732 [Tanacetum coccineum]